MSGSASHSGILCSWIEFPSSCNITQIKSLLSKSEVRPGKVEPFTVGPDELLTLRHRNTDPKGIAFLVDKMERANEFMIGNSDKPQLPKIPSAADCPSSHQLLEVSSALF